MPLRHRLMLLFAAILVGLLVVGSLAAYFIVRRDNTRSSERRLGIAQEQVAQLTAAYSDQETAVRGYALSGDEPSLEPFEEGTRRARRLVRSLGSTAREEPTLRAPLTDVVSAASTWQTTTAEVAIAQRRAGSASAAAATLSGRGQALFDQLRARVDELTAATNRAADDAEERATDARAWVARLAAFIVVIGLIGTLIAWRLIRRWVSVPLRELALQVRDAADGKREVAIGVPDPPEIAALATDVDRMHRRIEAQRDAAERSRIAVEQSAAVLLTLRGYLEPEVEPLPSGWTVAAELRAAAGIVAGDCYDLVFLDDHRVGLVVVDIAGHGAAEGILALRGKELVRAALTSGADPGAALDAAAGQLGDLGEEVFLSAFVAVLDTRDGSVRYANAGHPPGFVARRDVITELPPTGPVVGLFEASWDTNVATMEPGDSLCLYTDGLIEVRDADAEFFGPERLARLVQGTRCEDAPAVVKRCLDEVQLFAPHGLADDATIVVVCRPDSRGDGD